MTRLPVVGGRTFRDPCVPSAPSGRGVTSTRVVSGRGTGVPSAPSERKRSDFGSRTVSGRGTGVPSAPSERKRNDLGSRTVSGRTLSHPPIARGRPLPE